MESEVWKQTPGYEQYYQINKNGEVRSLHKKHFQRLIKSNVDRGGYVAISLSKGGTTLSTWVHRILAETYIPNPDNKCCVNHINGIKSDNRIENPEWVTHAENIKKAYEQCLCKPCVPKPVVDTSTGELFDTIKQAAEFYKIPYSTLKTYLNGHRKNPTTLILAEL